MKKVEFETFETNWDEQTLYRRMSSFASKLEPGDVISMNTKYVKGDWYGVVFFWSET